jgi:hypothetical protein
MALALRPVHDLSFLLAFYLPMLGPGVETAVPRHNGWCWAYIIEFQAEAAVCEWNCSCCSLFQRVAGRWP